MHEPPHFYQHLLSTVHRRVIDYSTAACSRDQYIPGLRITGSNLLGQAIVAEVLCHLKLGLTTLSHHSIALAPVQLPSASVTCLIKAATLPVEALTGNG